MFGIGPLELSMVLLIGGGTLGLPVGLPPLAPDATIQRAVPEECLALLYSAGTGEADAKSSNQTEQLLAEKEVREFVGQMREQVSKVIDQAVERNPQFQPLAKLGPPIAGLLLTRPAAFYVSHLEIRSTGPPDIRAALIVNCGKQTADAKQWVKELEELAAQNGAPVDQIKDIKLGGAELRQIKLEDHLEATWGFRDDYFLVGIGDGAAKELIERISATSEPAAWLVELEKEAAIPRLSTLAYLNAAKAWEIGLPLITDPQAKATVDALGLTSIKLVAAASGLDKRGVMSRTLAHVDGPPRGLLQLVSDKPLTMKDLQSIPQDVVVAGAFRLDLAEVFHHALEQIGKVNPQAVQNFERNLDGMQQSLGFQIERDLIGSLGDLWTVYSLQAAAVAPWTGLVASLTVRDHDKLAEVHDRLLGLAKLQGGGPDGPPFTIRKTKLGEATVYQLLPKGPVMFAPAWSLLEDRLVVAATLQGLKAHLAREATAPSLADVPEVAAPLDAKNPPAAIYYQDEQAMLRNAYGMIEGFAPILLGTLAQQGIEFDLPPLPSLEKLEPHILPAVQFVRRTPRGLLAEGHQSLPLRGNGMVVAPVSVALLLPAIQAAREAARRNQTTNNLKQIGLALQNHHDVYKKFPARGTTDKDGKPLLSWRVRLLPYLEENELYKQFHLDEPWDSEHNRQLIAKMPDIFNNPRAPSADGKTVFLAPAIEEGPLGETEGRNMKFILDGTSKTIIVVESNAEHAVPWTKPEDLAIDLKDPLAELNGGRAGGVFLALFVDGSVHALSETIDPTVLKALFTARGREPVQVPD